ncbi:unnamed protein product [Amoebophrya sp. A25]|nr:unnamed protein product [Amoebophrya sp. A25]|eukprot:GSA25T00005950001.1
MATSSTTPADSRGLSAADSTGTTSSAVGPCESAEVRPSMSPTGSSLGLPSVSQSSLSNKRSSVVQRASVVVSQQLGLGMRSESFQDYVQTADPLPSRISKSVKEKFGFLKKETQGRVMYPRVTQKFISATDDGKKKLSYNEDNLINTQRFGKWIVQWLPVSIYFQFRRMANIYFFIICCLQTMEFSPKMPAPTLATFFIVLIWTAGKDRYEDYQREKSDKKENHRTVEVLQKDKTWGKKRWKDVKANDIVRVHKDTPIPADMVLLATSHGGHCYIDTKNLDGETNLKLRMANTDLASLKEDSPELEDLSISVEPPHENMTIFKGSFSIDKRSDVPLVLDNILFRGCTLRNTEWVFGMAVYVGRDTKSMLNSREAPAKMPNMQHLLNQLLIGLFVILGVGVIICSTFGMVWESRYRDVMKYLQALDANGDIMILKGREFDTSTYGFAIKICVFIIVFSHLVPMSLYVALEVTKLILAYFVSTDKNMVHDDVGALCRNSDLMEELGQVEIIFSDKTGTLTCNKMEFVRGSVADKVYGPSTNAELEEARAMIKNDKEQLANSLLNDMEAYFDAIKRHDTAALDYFLLLAVCHAVVIDPDSGEYQGSSPDEVALVQGAASVGIRLTKSLNGEMEVELPAEFTGGNNPQKRAYKIHEVLEFDSDRKRMSVVVENKFEKKMEILTKGADMTVLPLLNKPISEMSTTHLHEFAGEGLRTLICAKKTLKNLKPDSNDMQKGCWYDGWKQRFNKAATSIENREQKVADVAEEVEKELNYIGITAVEDMLQDGVPDAIATLRSAQIRIWVLTGDKMETAVDIAFSCKLLDKSMTLKKLCNLTDVSDIRDALHDVHDACGKGASVGLALDGFTITTITDSHDLELAKLFFRVVMSVDAVMACRVAPKQKAFIVKVVRQNLPEIITLSIGDGANDVAMIQEAHVGVGIRGVEGTQAVQASDFAISQFRFLEPLILDHGRGAYRRVASFMCYYFYKNIALVMSDMYWSSFAGYSGQVLFPSWFSTAYNAFWTSFPCISCNAFDSDVSGKVARANPYLYQAGPMRVFFNARVFGQSIFLAVYHGWICFAIPYFAYGSAPMDETGKTGGFWWVSVLMFTCIVLVVNCRLFIITPSWSRISLAVQMLNFLFYFLDLIIACHTQWFAIAFQWQVYTMLGSIYGTAGGWIVTIVTVLLALLPDFLLEMYATIVKPNPVRLQMYHERKGLEFVELRPQKPGTTPLLKALPRVTQQAFAQMKQLKRLSLSSTSPRAEYEGAGGNTAGHHEAPKPLSSDDDVLTSKKDIKEVEMTAMPSQGTRSTEPRTASLSSSGSVADENVQSPIAVGSPSEFK